MKQYTVTKLNPVTPSGMKFHIASVPDQFKDIRVILGSDEVIFQDTYVSGMLANNRIVKFKKSTLVFA